MSSGLAHQQSRLKELIGRGREQGYLTYGEVNDHLPDEITDPEQIEDIIGMINDMGIAVHESAPENDDLLVEGDSTDELAAEEAAAVLVAVESEAGRTTDPVRMYMREMGTVELLTREGEIIIAKRIEEGIRDVLNALAQFPGVVELTLAEYEATQKDEGKLDDLLIGFLDPAEYVAPAAQVVPGQQKDDEEDEAEQEAVVDTIRIKCERALEQTGLDTLVIAGGVSANAELRSRLENLARDGDYQIFFPPLNLCTDNGVMIAYAGYLRLLSGLSEDYQINVRPRWPMTELN